MNRLPADSDSPRQEPAQERLAKSEGTLSRRNFTALLAASSATWSLTAAHPAAAQEKSAAKGAEKSADKPEVKPADKPADKPMVKPADLPDPTAGELALHLLLARFPDERLDPAAQASLLIDIERHQARSRALAQVELANGDEPGFLFAAYRRPENMNR